MANPFTRALTAQGTSNRLIGFIRNWDRLEQIIIRVYRSAKADEIDDQEWHEVRAILSVELPDWSSELAPHWQGTLIGGQPAVISPFEALIGAAHARDFIGNRQAMRTLPAAREALNKAIVNAGDCRI